MNPNLVKWEKPVFFLLAIGYGFTRSLRFPNDWSEAHWLITYDMGLLKRALVGTLLNPIFSNMDVSQVELTISLFSFVSVMIFIWLLWKVYQPLPLLVGLAVVVSPMVVMMLHLNGYFDFQLVFLGVLALYLIKYEQFILASVLLAIGILIHENCIFISMPAAFYAIYSRYDFSSKLTVPVSKVFALPLLVFLSILVFTDRNSESSLIQENIITGLGYFPFVASKIEYVAYSFTHSFVSYFKWRRSFLNPVYFMVFLNCLGMFFLLATGKKKQEKIMLGLILGFPLILQLIAVDTGRIWIFPLLIGLQLILNGGLANLDSSKIKFGAACLLIVNCVYTIPLMDDLVDRVPLLIRCMVAALAVFGLGFYKKEFWLANEK